LQLNYLSLQLLKEQLLGGLSIAFAVGSQLLYPFLQIFVDRDVAVHPFLQLLVLLPVELQFLLHSWSLRPIYAFAFEERFLLHLVDPHLFKRNGRASALQLLPEEVILLFELVDDGPFKYLVGLLVSGPKVEVVVLQSELALVLVELLVQVFHFLVGGVLHLFQHLLLVVLVLLFQSPQLVSEQFFLPLGLACLLVS